MTDAEYGASIRMAMECLDIPLRVLAEALAMSRYRLYRRLRGDVPFSAHHKIALDDAIYAAHMLASGHGTMGIAESERIRQLVDATTGERVGLTLDVDAMVADVGANAANRLIAHKVDDYTRDQERRKEDAAKAKWRTEQRESAKKEKIARKEAEKAAAARAKELERQRAANARKREKLILGEAERIRRGG